MRIQYMGLQTWRVIANGETLGVFKSELLAKAFIDERSGFAAATFAAGAL